MPHLSTSEKGQDRFDSGSGVSSALGEGGADFVAGRASVSGKEVGANNLNSSLMYTRPSPFKTLLLLLLLLLLILLLYYYYYCCY